MPKVVTDALPARLESIDGETLRFADSEDVWDCIEKLRRDGGYTLLKRKLGLSVGKR